MKLNSLQDLFVTELKDLYSAEKQLCKALPKMAKAAHSEQLKTALQEHAQQTQRQIERLDQVFQEIGVKARAEKCEAMQGIIEEGKDFLDASGDPDVVDAGIIGAAQKAEHYEIAGYGTARTFARELGNERVTQLLQETLNEEGQTDKRLTQIAESSINIHARNKSSPQERVDVEEMESEVPGRMQGLDED